MLQFLQRWLVRLLPPDTGAVPDHEQPASSGAPRFLSIAAFQPSRKALAYGAALSVVVFCVVTFVFNYGTSETLHTPFTGVASVRAAQSGDYVGAGNVVAGDQPRSPAAGDVPDLWPRISSYFTKHAPPPGKARATKPEERLYRHAASEPDVIWSKPLAAPPNSDRHAAAVASGFARGQNAPQPTASASRRTSGSASASPPRKPVTVPLQVLLSYTGHYVTDGIGPNILLKLDRSQLVLEQSGQPRTALIAISESRFFAPGPADRWIEFSHTRPGGLQIDIFQQGRHLTGRRQ